MPENQAAPDTPESIPNPESNEPGTSHLPFNSHHSAKICLRSALNIAQYFDELPYPNPIGVIQSQGLPGFLSPTSGIICPRTMPSYACCAMQCAYALLMIYQRTKSVYPLSVAEWNMELPSPWRGESVMDVGDDLRSASTRNLLVRLHRGLTSMSATLANYATAFEALGGMRGKMRYRDWVIAADVSQTRSVGQSRTPSYLRHKPAALALGPPATTYYTPPSRELSWTFCCK